ncbi:Transcription factor MYC2 [Leucoagaricus sp. SymC.cos]|nr:Transcription factor MYC2 [Leucoagaricus sp. SymC.cos]
MTLPLSPASGNSPASDIEAPHSPVSPSSPQQDSVATANQQQPAQAANPSSPTSTTANSQVKRKPSRRANTAERRATHNAVERQRRETLNGRFLDLAALLPNLSQIRRPSKSSIVNSSIAHIHASRRHRMLAARELRLLKHETDALRREINEWRDRAGIPRVEEPARGDAFSMVLSGELEIIAAVPGEEDNEEDNDYPGYEDEYPNVVPGHGISHGHPHHPSAHPHMDEIDDPRVASMIKSGHPFNPNVPSGPTGNGLHLAHILPRPSAGGAPMITSPTTYEGPNMYDSHHGFVGPPATGPGFMQQQQQQSMDAEKIAAWYGAQSQQQMMQAQRSLFTPPASSHGLPGSNGSGNGNGSVSPVNGNPASNGSGNGSKPPSPASANPFSDPSSRAFFAANVPRHQQGYASDEGSAGSNGSNVKRLSVPVPTPINVAGRGRALSTASHGAHSVAMSGSPGGASPVSTGAGSPAYELDGSFNRRPAPNGWRDEVATVSQQHGHNLMGMGMGMGSGMMMSGMGMPGMGNGLVGNTMGTMVSVGGGGNGGGFAMMM